MIYLLSRENSDGYKEPVCYFANETNAHRVCEKLNAFFNIARMSRPTVGLESGYLDLLLAVNAWLDACIKVYDPGYDNWSEFYTVTPIHNVLSSDTAKLAKLLISHT